MRGARTFLIGLMLAAALLVAVPMTAGAASSSTEMRRTMLHLTNTARRNNHLRPLDLNFRLSRSALAHSRRMARRHTVYHSANLYKLVRRWHPSVWGENVGMAGTAKRVHRLFMGSSAHRGNILRGGYGKVGIGLVRMGGRVWATVIFYGG
jgi:uncharacterized protein YkwD